MKEYIFEKNGDFYKLFYPEKKMIIIFYPLIKTKEVIVEQEKDEGYQIF